MTSINWENRVTPEHRRVVESGLFDRIPHAQPYEEDDIVVTRYSEDTFQVYAIVGETVTIGYDKGETSVRVQFDQDDIRPINGYAQIMYQIMQPNTEIQVDRRGHALITYPAKGQV